MSGAVATPLAGPTATATEQQMLQFLVLQALLKVQTVTLVEVQALHGGGLSTPGTVDVLPLVDQVDGANNAIPHVTLYASPYVRWQAGPNAIVLDPAVGDIGVMAFGSRDLSAVIATKKHGPPPSLRRFNYADGLYLGAVLGEVPTSYLQWLANGKIVMESVTEIDVTAPVIKLTGGGKLLEISSAGIVLDGITWETHKHTGVQTGGGETGGPTN